jgi:catalase
LFSYADAQRYRVGTNYLQLPVNRPRVASRNNNQAGAMNGAATNDEINYEPSIKNELSETPAYAFSRTQLSGTTQQQSITKTDNFSQAGAFYTRLDAAARDRLVSSFANDLKQVVDAGVKARIVAAITQANADYGAKLSKAIGLNK